LTGEVELRATDVICQATTAYWALFGAWGPESQYLPAFEALRGRWSRGARGRTSTVRIRSWCNQSKSEHRQRPSTARERVDAVCDTLSEAGRAMVAGDRESEPW